MRPAPGFLVAVLVVAVLVVAAFVAADLYHWSGGPRAGK